MAKLFTDEAEVLSLAEKAILLFRDQETAGERFSDTIDRLGFERAEGLMEGDELFRRREEILAKCPGSREPGFIGNAPRVSAGRFFTERGRDQTSAPGKREASV